MFIIQPQKDESYGEAEIVNSQYYVLDVSLSNGKRRTVEMYRSDGAEMI